MKPNIIGVLLIFLFVPNAICDNTNGEFFKNLKQEYSLIDCCKLALIEEPEARYALDQEEIGGLQKGQALKDIFLPVVF